MKRLLSLFIALMLALSMVACDLTTTNPSDTTVPETSTPVVDETTVPDLNANAIALLEDCVSKHLCDENFISVIEAYVPDLFMLQEIRPACWTYFLVMSDGIEYCVITDENGTITSITYWSDGAEGGPQIYPAE